jgi:hypothetical protein
VVIKNLELNEYELNRSSLLNEEIFLSQRCHVNKRCNHAWPFARVCACGWDGVRQHKDCRSRRTRCVAALTTTQGLRRWPKGGEYLSNLCVATKIQEQKEEVCLKCVHGICTGVCDRVSCTRAYSRSSCVHHAHRKKKKAKKQKQKKKKKTVQPQI